MCKYPHEFPEIRSLLCECLRLTHVFSIACLLLYDAQIPGVAINSSSAITGVEALCSPPPEHQPFNLPETYMHGKDAKAVADPTTLPGERAVPCTRLIICASLKQSQSDIERKKAPRVFLL